MVVVPEPPLDVWWCELPEEPEPELAGADGCTGAGVYEGVVVVTAGVVVAAAGWWVT